MSKKDMVYEIISHTKLHSISEADVNRLINKLTKARVTEVYNQFVNDKEHALFYYSVL